MKGVIPLCTKELIVNNYGKEKLEEILKNAGIEKEPMIVPIADVDDNLVLGIIKSIGEVLNLSLVQIADAFGDYWTNVYSQRLYGGYYKNAKNAKEFLMKIDKIHIIMTKNIENAKPPCFEYEDLGNKLIMTYNSQRGLIDFVVGIIKGIGKFYNEKLLVKKLSDNKLEIIFEN